MAAISLRPGVAPGRWLFAALAGLALAGLVALLLATGWGGVQLLRTAATDPSGAWSAQPLLGVLSQRFMLASPLLNSLLLSVPVAALAVAIGGALAWLTQRSDFPGGPWLLPLVALPHIIPGFQLGSAWVEIVSHGGLWQTFTGLRSPVAAYGYAAMLVVMTAHLLLFPYLIVSGALQAADPALEEAGRIAGLSPARVFWRITLTLTRPALLSALLLVFAYAMEEFGIPSLLGTPSGFDTLTTRIYGLATTPPLDLASAAVLAVVLGAIALAVLWAQLRLLAGQRLETLAGKASRKSRVQLSRWRWPVAVAVWAVLAVVAIAPLLTLVLVSLLDSWGQGWGPDNWTLARYAALWHSEELRRAVWNTLLLAVASAAVVVAVAAAIVYGGQRLRWPLARLADRVSFVVFALPGLVVGLAAILAFSGGWLPLYGTVWILLLAYALRFAGIGVRTVSARLAQIGVELEAAAQVAGLSRLRLLAKVVLPLLAPALASSAVLVFINAVKEISATSLLASQGSQTLAFEAYVRFQEGNYTQGSAISVVMIALVLAVLALGRWLARGKTQELMR